MATNKGTATSVSGAEYMFTRSYRDSARLHLQHWIWKEHLGYTLHPSIPWKSAQNWRVADIGTGNACWILDLAHQAPPTWTFDGFDVSPQQFPHEAVVPSNVTLSVRDAFADIPVDLHGKFDLVHIRAFGTIVKNGDPTDLLRNLALLVKPGGYVQYDEFDSASFSAYTAVPGIVKVSTDKAIEVFAEFSRRLALDYGWMGKGQLAKGLEGQGLKVVNDIEADRWNGPEKFKPLLKKAYTDNWMSALEEVSFVIINRGGAAGSIISPEDFTELLRKVVEEVNSGVNLWIDFQVVVAQKPE